ncbi:MAG: PSD1 and planctomycete cytochrome C domain-containing protein [Terriglobia bacterium]
MAVADSSKPAIDEAARKILETHCLACHGESRMSGLDIRQRDDLLKGGQRGPAVILGKALESRLYEAAAQIGELKMPPGQKPIPAEELDVLRQWIDQGLPWTVTNSSPSKTEPSWWSFRRPQRPSVPKIGASEESIHPIDAFILAKLEEKGLAPAPIADKRTLIRRAYFDLLGLPPSPAQVESFVNNPSPKAYEALIDELLASPQYGERWGRHWLDVVRYADTGGYETDIYYPNAWRYRDYVVRAFNQDRPYDRFLQEQIAGDEIWPDDLNLDKSYKISPLKLEHLEARMGTGLYTLGPEIHESNMDARKLLNEKLTDWADTTGAVFMGLTLGCARCHDHKFDPISQKDYYSFQAIFAGSKETEFPVVMGMSVADHKQHYPRAIAVEEARIAYRLFEKKVKDRAFQPREKEFSHEAVAAFEIPEDRRSMQQKELAAPLVEAYNSIKLEEVLTPEEKQEQRTLYEKIAKTLLAIPERDAQGAHFDGIFDLPLASGLGHREPDLIPPINILFRGDLDAERDKVSPAVPAVFQADIQMEAYSTHSALPHNRKKLALWLSQPDHPLTARVMVNRIWMWHFGRGIVSTPNDFGRQGQPPSHPELLDWLATEFVSRGWSIKSMHRLMMLRRPISDRVDLLMMQALDWIRRPLSLADEPPAAGS